jgi:hypothetical protein
LQDNEEEKYYKTGSENVLLRFMKREKLQFKSIFRSGDPKNQSESYQQFLNFMWNLSLDEIKNIADYYQTKES